MPMSSLEMKTLYLSALSLCILTLTSCTPPKESLKSNKNILSGIHNGTATTAQLVEAKGEPKEKTASISKPGSQSFQYQDGENYQVQEGKVVAKFRAPRPEETSLNYWRNVFKEVPTTFTEIKSSNDHEKIFELRAPSIGSAVLYDEQSKQVIRVIEHANQ